MKKLSSREKTESQFLMITGILLAFVGAPAFHSLVKEPVKETIRLSSYQTRIPASIDQQEDEQNNSKEVHISQVHSKVTETNAIVQLNCKDSKNIIDQEVQSAQLRLAGNGCLKNAPIKIQNKTNGYTAEVFFTGEQQFTTDYIDLSVGENDVEVITSLKDGSSIKKNIKINRRQPASARRDD